MTTITFDTYAAIRRLKSAGFDEQQAEALSDTIKEAQDTRLNELASEADFHVEIGGVRAELLVIKWMLGLILLVTVIPVLRGFFIH